MAHSHSHDHGMHGHAPNAITRAIIVTLIFMAIEFIGGWFSNSLALISDAAHMLTDVGAMLLSLFSLWVARRPSTPMMSWGYHRAEILGALLSGLSIWMISGVLIYEAIERIPSPPQVHGPIVFIVATIGLGANLASMWMLKSAKTDNINVRAAYLHLLSDSFGSLGAIIAGIVLWLTGWRLIDPLMTIAFAVLMLLSSWSLVKEAVEVLMESTPNHLNPTEIREDLNKIEGVLEIHDLHIWTLSSGRLALSVHIVSEKMNAVLNSAQSVLQEEYGIHHTTIQIEHPQQFDSKRCYDCVPIEIPPLK